MLNKTKKQFIDDFVIQKNPNSESLLADKDLKESVLMPQITSVIHPSVRIHLTCLEAYHFDFIGLFQNYFYDHFSLEESQIWHMLTVSHEIISNAILWGSLNIPQNALHHERFSYIQSSLEDETVNKRPITISLSPRKDNQSMFFNLSAKQFLPINLKPHKDLYRGLSIVEKHKCDIKITRDQRELIISMKPL